MDPWKTERSAVVADYGIFRVRQDGCVSPRTQRRHDFWVLETADWVNIMALTPDDQVVLIRQYRFGSQRVTLEIAGGVVDPDEDPLVAGVRELREETGYQAETAVLLGFVEPNPGIQNNRCYTVLALGCRPLFGQQLDEREDIGVELRPLSAIPQLLAGGEITHALVWAAFQHYELWRQGRGPAHQSEPFPLAGSTSK